MKVEVSSLSPITQSRLTRSTLALLISVAPTLEVSAQTPDATSEEVEEQQGEEGEINVRNADISAIIRIFSRRIKRNFLLDERVRGKVTMYLPGDVSAEDSLKILDSVLALKGFTAVPVSENLWKVIPSKEARNTTIPTYTGEEEPESPTAAVITRLVTLKHVAADELQPLLQELVSPDGLLTSYQGTNSLLIIDYENNIDRLQKIIRELDVPFTDRELTIVPVSNADAVDIAEKLKDLLGEGQKTEQDQPGVDTRPRNIPGQPPLPPGQAAAVRATAQTAGSSAAAVRSRAPKIIADERTNSIIVLADDESTARVRALVHQLDSKVDLSGNRFYVYRCQHADAEELAQVLGSLSGGVTGGSGTGTAGRQTARGDDDDLFGGSRGSRTRTVATRRAATDARNVET
jgi:general secretion pathway protein D